MKQPQIFSSESNGESGDLHYGVAHKTSPWKAIRTFSNSTVARDWIKREKVKHPGNDYLIVVM